MKITKNDMVEIITGEDAGKRERVLYVLPKSDRLLVEHVNFVTKHVRRSRDNPNGTRLQKEAPIHKSNCLLVCSHCDRGVRVGFKSDEKGNKVRVCRGCGNEIPKPRYK
jgi:large subunit ribosomal protein L24